MAQNTQEIDFFDRVQAITERYLTHRLRVRRIKKEKQRAKNTVLEWIEAFLWAAGMVLLINQYLVQAYKIPSGSMINTLNINDHVFVNKIVYGPELLPGFLKLPSPIKPKRNDIIIFENPAYISKGTVFDIAQRIIYMLTLSLVDIDRDEEGNQRVHFLIKRMAAQAGDRVKLDKGEIKILFAGEERWVDEREYNSKRGWNHNISRIVEEGQYSAIEASGQAVAWLDRGHPISDDLRKLAGETQRILPNLDFLARDSARLDTLRIASPADRRYAALASRQKLGWYIPEGRMMPLGDNRDNSHDGRFFGPVRETRVLGKGIIIYWPLSRMGRIH